MSNKTPLESLRIERDESDEESDEFESKDGRFVDKPKNDNSNPGEKKNKVEQEHAQPVSRKNSSNEMAEREKTPEEIQKLLTDLETSEEGLTTASATERLTKYGPNKIDSEKVNPVLQFLASMWNPLAWVMEIAAIIAIALLDYGDFVLILILLLVNSTIAFFESRSAQKAIDALINSLSPTCLCYRDGKLKQDLSPEDLVPGDVILIRIGSIVPADCVLLQEDGLLVDQSSLTGESLPVNKGHGGEVYAGSIIKRGEVRAVIICTGKNTRFGKTAELVATATSDGQFQMVLSQVGWFCIGIIALGVIIELAIQFGVRHKPCVGTNCPTVGNILVLIVGGIPVAMPTVLSVTLAIGAHQLAQKDAIVSRLTAIEDLSAMDILCSDKTGTLTKNELSVNDPISYNEKYKVEDILFLAALSVPGEPGDPIDVVLVKSISEDQKAVAKGYKMIQYHPFHPINKTTSIKLQTPEGHIMRIKKGAPQSILEKAANRKFIGNQVNNDIQAFGKRGFRCIGVAESNEEEGEYMMVGLIPLFDPPRDDTAETIKNTMAKGIGIKMITGDQLAIAVETARLLGLKTNILTGDYVRDKQKAYQDLGVPIATLIEEAGGFAQVYPEDKYFIVKQLHKNGHIVGMTGDGVNDTAALKQADIGIAVAGASDAARSASDIVLKTPGLSVIVEAIIGSRKIFQRMQSYCIYSISMAVRVVLAFVILTTVYDWYFPTIAIVILAVLNDGCMISISRDRVTPSEFPEKWRPIKVFAMAIGFGCYLGVSTIVLFQVAVNTQFFQSHFGLATLGTNELAGLIYVQLSVGGLATIFITRSHTFSFLDRPGLFVVLAFILAQIIASVLGAYGLPSQYNGFGGSGWGYVLVGWVWSIVWFVPMDACKVAIFALQKTQLYKHLAHFHKATANQRHATLAKQDTNSHELSQSKQQTNQSKQSQIEQSKQSHTKSKQTNQSSEKDD
jgi:H+-transporting ATPase